MDVHTLRPPERDATARARAFCFFGAGVVVWMFVWFLMVMFLDPFHKWVAAASASRTSGAGGGGVRLHAFHPDGHIAAMLGIVFGLPCVGVCVLGVLTRPTPVRPPALRRGLSRVVQRSRAQPYSRYADARRDSDQFEHERFAVALATSDEVSQVDGDGAGGWGWPMSAVWRRWRTQEAGDVQSVPAIQEEASGEAEDAPVRPRDLAGESHEIRASYARLTTIAFELSDSP